jgi:parallel beta-helix repeat protein
MPKSDPSNPGTLSRRSAQARPSSRRRPTVEVLEGRRLLATFTVTNTNDSGAGSLRRAINQVDAGADNTIAFDIPGIGAQVIAVTSPLPTITSPVTIDATTEPGYSGKPLVALKAASNSAAGDGLLITAGSSTVRGLAIYGFTGDGLDFQIRGGNTVAADYIGVKPNGTAAPGNNSGGITFNNTSHNTVGGLAATAANLIAGNGGDGIYVGSGTGNVISGNAIGTDPTGTLNLANTGDGIDVNGATGASTNSILENVVGYNQGRGIDLTNSANFLIQGNTILWSKHRGVAVVGSSAVTVGQGSVGTTTIAGTTLAAGNTIEENGLNDPDGDDGGDGAHVAAGVAVVQGSSNVTVIGDTVTHNGRGVRVSGSGAVIPAGQTASILIEDDTISNNATQGVWVDDRFGGPSRNVLLSNNVAISNNGGSGVRIDDSSSVALTGNHAIDSNGGDGVYILPNCLNVTLTSGNVIDSNAAYGIEDLSASVPLPSTTANTIVGNSKGAITRS